MFRTFKVAVTSAGKNKKVSKLFITDAEDDNEISSRPIAAEFPVSELFDESIQRARAYDYCDYLNKLVEAAKEAYEQNKLINILKA